MINKRETGITLIALIITIIVLLILAGTTIAFLFGDNGIITRARWSSFVTELSAVKENAVRKESEHAMKILLDGESKVSPFEKLNLDDLSNQLNIKSLPSTLKAEIETLSNGYDNIYIVDKDTGNGKDKTYLWDDKEKIVYKIKGIKILNSLFFIVLLLCFFKFYFFFMI